MLAKLEKEIPVPKLRLMGLRCTHLVSTRKDDGNFFGPAAKQLSLAGETVDDEGWEVFPDAEFEESARQERQDEFDQLERLSHEQDEHQAANASNNDFHEPFGRYKTNHLRNTATPTKRSPVVLDKLRETWICPICSLPQPASDNDAFNSHIDFCLSRRTIKETVASNSAQDSRSEDSCDIADGDLDPSQHRPRKRKAQVTVNALKRRQSADRKQKKLFFT